MSDEKIVELEEKIAFLQNMIDELNMVVFRQGEKLEKLNLKLKDTHNKLLDQSESISVQNEASDDKPPHY
ncbi:SlyX family protein [Pseudothioglobus sp. nBUS_23]|uniref:SlyX family protein n=1 Tax=Pseudothioglobus sp. nBUS_23 TaxID=3395318 RepID=UPI003EB6DE8E